MLLIGAILLLLGTSLGEPATKTEVKYDGPEKITVVQEENDNLALPGIGQPPFAPNLFHHGANFFFNSQVVMPGGAIPKIDREIVIPPLNDCNINVVTPEVASLTLIAKEPSLEPIITKDIPESPSIAIRELEIQKILEPLPDMQVEIVEIEPLPVIPPGPELPALIEIPKLPVTVQEPPKAVISENAESNQIILDVPMVIEEPVQPIMPDINIQKILEPLPDMQVEIVEIEPLPVIPPGPELPALIEIPKLPVTVQEPPKAVISENAECNQIILDVPMVIEEPVQPITPDINIHITDLPPPPELPPIVFSEIPRPIVIEESKRVVLIPSAPQLTAFYPPSVYFSEGQLIPTDCAQNIILERVLPNIAFEYGRTLELISIPAAKRPPVVSTIIYP